MGRCDQLWASHDGLAPRIRLTPLVDPPSRGARTIGGSGRRRLERPGGSAAATSWPGPGAGAGCGASRRAGLQGGRRGSRPLTAPGITRSDTVTPMALTSTRTYTRFFSEDQPEMQMLLRSLTELAEEWHERMPHLDDDVARAGSERLQALTLAATRLTDRVP